MSKVIREIDLSVLPKRKGKMNKIDWKNSIGYKINFTYDDIKGEIEIIEYDKKTNNITILFENKYSKISTGRFRECCLGNILNKHTKEFKLEIGQTFKDEKRDLTIIDREYREEKNNRCKKYYKYHCNKCGAELWMEENNLITSKYGCSCCCIPPKTVVKGINDVATTHPELVKYFVNTEDTYTHTYCSGDKILCKCNICGHKKEIIISNLYKQGFSCPICGDGISYPEKIMSNLLQQLNIDFVYQYTSKHNKWCNNYRYDFYFKLNGENYIVETHGRQHYEEAFGGSSILNENKTNDKNKKELAINHGIKSENYIVIDCSKSELDFIKNNIINSRLSEIFDLNNINWYEINENSLKSKIKEICDYWYIHNNINNENLSTKDLEKIFKISDTTIRKYLKQGNKLNWCNYNAYEEISKGRSKTSRGIVIEVFKDDKSLGVFKGIQYLENNSEKLFGVKLIHQTISDVCNGKRSQYKGYTFKYINQI